MPIGEQADEQSLGEVSLPYHGAAHAFGERLDETGICLNVGVQRIDIFIFCHVTANCVIMIVVQRYCFSRESLLLVAEKV